MPHWMRFRATTSALIALSETTMPSDQPVDGTGLYASHEAPSAFMRAQAVEQDVAGAAGGHLLADRAQLRGRWRAAATLKMDSFMMKPGSGWAMNVPFLLMRNA